MSTQHAQYVLLVLILAGSKVRLVSNFTELHGLTQAARSYALLLQVRESGI